MDNIENFLQKKEESTLNKENKLTLYHGTNRKFTEHSPEFNRTVLNNEYQGDWICYTNNPDIAWKYTHAARNQCFDKKLFLQDCDEFFKDKKHGQQMYRAFILLMEEGYEAWDRIFKEFADENNILIDEASKIFFQNAKEFENEHNLNFDDFMDILSNVEYNKLNQEEDNINIFSQNIPSLRNDEIKYLEDLGFKYCIPENRLIISEVTYKNKLVTNSREEALNARKKGFDLVVYNGEGTVDNEPEYLVAEPSQVQIKTIIAKDTKTIYLDEFESEWREEHSYRKVCLKDKENITNKNKLKGF